VLYLFILLYFANRFKNMAKTISIQGQPCSFHEIAMREYFQDEDISAIYCQNFPEVFDNISSGKSEYGVVAFENSIAGSILSNNNRLESGDYYIVGEIFLRIHMHLMAIKGQKLENVRKVLSHPIALQQSEAFLITLKNITLEERDDTADSAREIAEFQIENAAALASAAAAEKYNLEILTENVQSIKNNQTRFQIIKGGKGKSQENFNKSTISFSTSHNSGSLARALLVLAKNRISLTKIQSIPRPGESWKYNFHCDMEVENQEDYRKGIEELRGEVENLRIFGEYVRGKLFNQ
jgi:prephenate dehydratase